jgi:hypothetical protein
MAEVRNYSRQLDARRSKAGGTSLDPLRTLADAEIHG